MDNSSFIFNSVHAIVLNFLHLHFSARFTGKKPQRWLYCIYFLMFLAENLLQLRILTMVSAALTLYIINRYVLVNSHPAACITAILALSVSWYAINMVNTLLTLGLINFSVFAHGEFLFSWISLLISYLLCYGGYRVIFRWFRLRDTRFVPHPWMLMTPCLFFLGLEFYLSYFHYGSVVTYPIANENSSELALLLLQAAGAGALFCTLYAYKRTCDGLAALTALSLLEQETHAQKIYAEQAQMRYEQTRAFRHDIKNHLTVLDGLLKSGSYEQAGSYLQKLNAVTGDLSFPVHSGSLAVDILFADKLALAKSAGIETDVCLELPAPCKANELDLCVIFANALDNAIHACRELPGDKQLHITGEKQGAFYLIEFENTCSPDTAPAAGTGLSNIAGVADKYGGAIDFEKQADLFRLHVLLNIS